MKREDRPDGRASGKKKPKEPIGKPADRGTGKSAGTGKVSEIGGRKGLDPTRYGDWEKNGRCIDF